LGHRLRAYPYAVSIHPFHIIFIIINGWTDTLAFGEKEWEIQEYYDIPKEEITEEIANKKIFGEFAHFALSVEDAAVKKRVVKDGTVLKF